MYVYSEDAIVYGNYTEDLNPYYAHVISDEDAESGIFPFQHGKEPLPLVAPNSEILGRDEYLPVAVVETELRRVFGDEFKGFYYW